MPYNEQQKKQFDEQAAEAARNRRANAPGNIVNHPQ